MQLVPIQPMVAEDSFAFKPTEHQVLPNQRDTLTPSDMQQKRSKSKSRESKLDSKKIRESIQSKQIDLDNFNDDISGLRLGALFKPYKDGRSNSSS